MKKNDRKPTLKQKKMITSAKFIPENWLVRRQERGVLIIVSKKSGMVREIAI